MTSTVPGLTIAEIAAKYGRAVRTIEQWRQAYDWPAPAGARPGTGGRPALEYDPDAVAAAVRAILALAGDGADPDELLTAREAAEEAGLSYGTVRADISRGRWPEADRPGRWKRSTVRAAMAARRPHRARRANG